MKGFFAKILSQYLGVMKYPEEFSRVLENRSKAVLVTQSSSIIIEAFLTSLASKSRINEVVRLSNLPESDSALSLDNNSLNWVSIENEVLIENLYQNNPALNFITFSIFMGRGPVRSAPQHSMSKLELLGLLLTMLFTHRSIIVAVGSPIAIPKCPRNHKRFVVRRLKVDFYRNLKRVRGTPFQTIEAQSRAILGGHEYERELSILSRRLDEDPESVHKKAQREFFRVAANPSSWTIRCTVPIARFIIGRLFSRVVTNGLDNFIQASQEHPVVIIPMHRSHFDYVIISSTLYGYNLNIPLIAAGMNLSFWPAGRYLRSLSAYFVRRNARHDRIHGLILRRYVSYLTKRGHLQEFFIEGGRSRSGKMMSPRAGLLNVFINAYLKGMRKDILFLPVSISYEHVIEDRIYGDENSGKPKRQESLIALLSAWKLFTKQYGEVVLNFQPAISLAEFQQRNSSGNSLALSLAGHISKEIESSITVTLSSLACTALMISRFYTLTSKELIVAICELANLVKILEGSRGKAIPFSPTLISFLEGQTSLLEHLTQRGQIEKSSALGKDVYFIPRNQRYTADFYKNSSIHALLPFSVMALQELLYGKISNDGAEKIYDLFAYDFLLPEKTEFVSDLKRLAETLIQKKILTKKKDKVLFRSRTGNTFIPLLLTDSIQGRLWVYQNLQRKQGLEALPASEASKPEPLKVFNYSNFLKNLQDGFLIAYRRGLFNRIEASSKTTLISSIDYFRKKQILSVEGSNSEKTILFLKEGDEIVSVLQQLNDAVRKWENDLPFEI